MREQLRTALLWTVEDLNGMLWNLTVNAIAPSELVPRVLRHLIYRAWGMRISGPNVLARCFFKMNKIDVGRRTFINRGCYFDNLQPVSIGENCAIGMEVMFCTVTHAIGRSARRVGQDIGKPIRVGNGCWVGSRVTILPGVTVGDGCVIGAGALVTKDCAPNGLYVGVPATRVRDLE